MTNFILIFVYLFLGLALQRVKWIPASTYKVLNKIAINFCLPFSFVLYTKIQWNNELYPIGCCLVGFGASFYSLFFRKKLACKTGCLMAAGFIQYLF
jgi:predicted permease